MASNQLIISELFYSIQGESSFAGLPCVFIRLAGCNLRCSYCDARYTYEEEGKPYPVSDLLTFADQYPSAQVEITGGEPLLQDNIYPLMDGLLSKGRCVLLETNGSIDLSRVPEEIIKIIDIKCPDSGMADHFDHKNLDLLTANDEIKFVLSSKRDYDWAREMLLKTIPDMLVKKGRILFSPVQSALAPQLLAQWILDDQLQVRLQLQLHKIIWPDKQRGV